MKSNFRENLRNELYYQGITVKELSVRTGIPVASLDCYLGNRATIPSADTAVKIARALQVTVEFLVTGENAGMKKPLNKPSREALEIIGWIENLNFEQCRTVHKLVKILKM